MGRVWVIGLLVLGCGRVAPRDEVPLPAAVDVAPVGPVSLAAAPEFVAPVMRPDAGPDVTPVLTPAQLELLSKRPYRSVVPHGYDGSVAVPMIVALHGYSSSGQDIDDWYHLSELAEARTFILATPDGTRDVGFQRFWNATDGCCNLYGSQVDDVAYVTAIIDDLRSKYRIDPRAVFLVGHSNGSFMSHRMACDMADRVVAIAALAGDVWQDASKCKPSQPVSVLQIHGTVDPVINFNGVGLFPSADQSVATWAAKNGCDSTRVSAGVDLDLDAARIGTDTTREKHDHCAGGAAELWRIEGAGHHPTFTPEWGTLFYDWLLEHRR